MADTYNKQEVYHLLIVETMKKQDYFENIYEDISV